MTKTRRASALAVLLLALGCGGSGSGASPPGLPDDPGAGGAAGSAGGAGASGAAAAGGNHAGPFVSGCADGVTDIFVIDADNHLFAFHPPTREFTYIARVTCPTQATPFSMAVARNGTAYSVFTDGSLWAIDTATAACSSTAFVPGQSGFTTFGMGFSSQGDDQETLFVSSSDGQGNAERLGTIDLTSFKLTPIGAYDKLQARAELTGTGDGRLFGAFEGSPYVVAGIDETTATIESQAPQTAINYSPNSSNFAFAFWGADFWLFVGPGTKTDVFHYDPAKGTTELVKSINQQIVGAGVSTCAPVVKPIG